MEEAGRVEGGRGSSTGPGRGRIGGRTEQAGGEEARRQFVPVLVLQGGFFNWSPPKLSKYKIPLKLLTFREIPGQFAWDPVLRKFMGGPVKRTTLYITVLYMNYCVFEALW